MSRLVIYGAGGFGREVIAVAQDSMALGAIAADALIFVVDHPEAREICGIPVLDFEELRPGDQFVLAIADSDAREKLEAKCIAAGLIPATICAGSFQQGPSVQIDSGAVFCAHTMVTASATIGRQFQCNIYSYVAHDCVIGDYVTFAPRVSVNGNVHIGDHAYIGTGAVIKPGIQIGKRAIVGMGAVVTKDVPPGAVVMGNPARAR